MKHILKLFFRKTKYNIIYIVGDLNRLYHGINAKVQDYLNLTFKTFLYLSLKKDKSDQKNTTLIYDILANASVNTKISIGIGKSDISLHKK